MFKKPIISVIIPVYNLENSISKTLDSVCAQTYDNLQIIIVNDGSKDHSLEVCQTFAENDSRITLINKQNEGLSIARKSGLKAAKGEYIHHLDGGDWIDPTAYEQMVKELNEQMFPDVLIFGFYFTTSVNTEKSGKYPSNVNSPIEFLKHIWTSQQYNAVWQYIHKRELADEIEFDERLSIGEDAYYTSQLMYNAVKFVYLDKNLLYYVIDDYNSMTRSRYSEKAVQSLLLFPVLIDQFMSSKPEYKEVEVELYALKLQSYAILLLEGHLEKMNLLAPQFMKAFAKYPQLQNMGQIKRVRKLVKFYSRCRPLYSILVKRYRKKGKIK